jgi:hypothetical protein
MVWPVVSRPSVSNGSYCIKPTCSEKVEASIRDLLVIPQRGNLAQLSDEKPSPIRHILRPFLLLVDGIEHLPGKSASEAMYLPEVSAEMLPIR